jgi:general secretion pathway protein G
MHMYTRHRSAFTLIELLLVLAILGVIMSMVLPNLLGRQKYANIDASKASVKGAEQAIRIYALDHLGDYPSSDQGFRALTEAPSHDPQWRGPYLTATPRDAWGTPLLYAYPGKKNTEGFDVYSAGPDKTPGTEDDLGNWETTPRP